MNNLLALNIQDVFEPAKKFTSIASLFNIIVPNVIILAGIIFFVITLRAGFILLGSSGNPEQMKKAQKLLTYGVVGLVIILFSYILVKLVPVIFPFPSFPL